MQHLCHDAQERCQLWVQRHQLLVLPPMQQLQLAVHQGHCRVGVPRGARVQEGLLPKVGPGAQFDHGGTLLAVHLHNATGDKVETLGWVALCAVCVA